MDDQHIDPDPGRALVIIGGRDEEIKLSVSDAALKAVAAAGFDPVYGARPLKHAIQQQIENPLAKEILGGRYGPGDTVRVTASGGAIAFAKR